MLILKHEIHCLGEGEFYILKTFDTLQFYSRNCLIINYLYYNSAILIF